MGCGASADALCKRPDPQAIECLSRMSGVKEDAMTAYEVSVSFMEKSPEGLHCSMISNQTFKKGGQSKAIRMTLDGEGPLGGGGTWLEAATYVKIDVDPFDNHPKDWERQLEKEAKTQYYIDWVNTNLQSGSANALYTRTCKAEKTDKENAKHDLLYGSHRPFVVRGNEMWTGNHKDHEWDQSFGAHHAPIYRLYFGSLKSGIPAVKVAHEYHVSEFGNGKHEFGTREEVIFTALAWNWPADSPDLGVFVFRGNVSDVGTSPDFAAEKCVVRARTGHNDGKAKGQYPMKLWALDQPLVTREEVVEGSRDTGLRGYTDKKYDDEPWVAVMAAMLLLLQEWNPVWKAIG
jgi:hypothetical protein